MGSLNNGQIITKSYVTKRIHHVGTQLRKTDTVADTGIFISNSGVDSRANYAQPFGVEHMQTSRTFISGQPIKDRELQNNDQASGILKLELEKFQSASGQLEHDVSRAMGIHTSVSHREAPNSALGPMDSVLERKAFWLDSDTGKASGLANWKIYDNGTPVGTATGTSDFDATPSGDFDG